MKTRVARQYYLPLQVFSTLVVTLLLINMAGQAHAQANDDMSIIDRSSKEFVNVVKQAQPGVVHIRVEQTTEVKSPYNQYSEEFFNNPFFEQFFGPQWRQQQQQQQPQTRKQKAQGSGFIISKDGYILTNNHVVENADKITVFTSDEQEYKGELIGADPQSDVALIKISADKDLPVLPLGDSDKLEVGEWVIAIGNPFGLSQTVTAGVVSAKGRNRVGLNDYENFIQTDAAINPGNSGGPLLNGRGEVVGINSALYSRTGGYMGIGFAIPINMVKSIEDQLHNNGTVTRGWLGVVIQDVTKDLAATFGLKDAKGILVSEVQKDSPADKAGIENGDVIIKLDGKELKDVTDLRNRVAMITPGTKVALEVIRDTKEKHINVEIGKQPENFGHKQTTTPSQLFDKFGLSLQNLTSELAERFGFEKGQGVIISDVKEGSPAEDAGLKAGFLVEEINQIPVRSIDEATKALEKSKNSGRTLLRINTGNARHYVVLVTQ